uniref:carboxypeptidase-like regulatory domain-containing protein n=1 Tax=Persicitalea sp. TaxID=3100273 RepID=UPI003593824B
MSKIPIYIRTAFLAILVISQLSLAGFSQTLAYVQQSKSATSTAPNTTLLRSVLLDLQKHYQVEIIFEDRLIAIRTVPARSIDYTRTVDSNLARILTPVNLKVKKIRKNTFIISEVSTARQLSEVVEDKTKASADSELVNSASERNSFKYPQLEKIEETPKRIIRGTVTDENNAGLPGVSVVVKGTTRGTTTNGEGTFELDVQEAEPVLVFSFVGFATQEITLGNRTQLDVRMAVDDKSLDEVVVVGYGVQRKSDLTGAVGAVKGETLRERPTASLNQALSGRITGVNVST